MKIVNNKYVLELTALQIDQLEEACDILAMDEKYMDSYVEVIEYLTKTYIYGYLESPNCYEIEKCLSR